MTASRVARRALVCVVDDDQSVREALPDLLGEFGLEAQVYACAEDLLASGRLAQAECLIVDVAMPGMTGPELQAELRRRGHGVAIIFITAHGDEAMRALLIEQGAVACLFKPFSDTALFDAVTAALASNRSDGMA